MKNFELLKELFPIKTDIEPALKELQDVKAILFDIYGTMLISAAGDIFSTELHAKSVVSVFDSVDIELNESIPMQDIGSIIIGEYMENILLVHDNLKNEGVKFPEVDVVAIWKKTVEELHGTGVFRKISMDLDYEILALDFELKTNPVWPMPGLKDIIEKLSNTDKLLGIVSNSQFFTPMIMNYFLDNENYFEDNNISYFDPNLCVYSYREGVAKPDPLLFSKIVTILDKEYQVKPEEVVYVGNDMLNDVYCAYKVGFKTALFAGDVRSLRLRTNDDRVTGIKPDIVITDLKQLLNVVKGN